MGGSSGGGGGGLVKSAVNVGNAYSPVYSGYNQISGGAVGNALGGSTLGGALTGENAMNAANGAFGAGGLSRPQGANIQQGTSVSDVQNAQAGAANSLKNQEALLAALQNQNGLGQQTGLLNQQWNYGNQLVANNGIGNQANAMNQQQSLNAQLAAANGVGTQNQAIQGLQNAAGMYGNIAAGRGPNPAQAMLNQQTGQNVANQAALMAGQRGAGSNVGLLARQAAQQGAATQQQAVGQGAALQAQQQVNALQGLTGAEQAIGGLGTTQAGMQQAGIGQQAGLANQQIGQVQAQQQSMANQANVMAGQQIGATTANTQAQLANQQQMQNALQGINQANVSSQSSVNAANAGLAAQQMKGQQQVAGGLASSIGGFSNLSGVGKAAYGGEIKKMADGGIAEAPNMPPPSSSAPIGAQAAMGPSSSFGQFLQNYNLPQPEMSSSKDEPELYKPEKDDEDKGDDTQNELLKTGLTALVLAAKGGLAKSGGHVVAKNPSQKAVKRGDDYANDKVPAKLSEGEIVLPRSVTMSKDPVKASARFVAKVLAKRKGKK